MTETVGAHRDAIGYLQDLASDTAKPWFSMLTDLAIRSAVPTLDELELETLFALYIRKASYVPLQAAQPAVAAPQAASADTLLRLSGFSNFKMLGPALRLDFAKRLTIVFGANGSGKSSLCESLKMLAGGEMSSRPLHNVRGQATSEPSFTYQFKSDSSERVWTPAAGIGPRSDVVKYFDTAIAAKHIRAAVEPGRVVTLTPFRLHTFEWLKALVDQFRESLQYRQRESERALASSLEHIRELFARFRAYPLASVTEATAADLDAESSRGRSFSDGAMLASKALQLADLEKSSSEEGMKLLKAEHRELQSLLAVLVRLVEDATNFCMLEPFVKATQLAAKQQEQEVLANALKPNGFRLEQLLELARAASGICQLDNAEGSDCPLCRRGLHAEGVELFKQYHSLLNGAVEKEITALKAELARAKDLLGAIERAKLDQFDAAATLPNATLSAAKDAVTRVITNCGMEAPVAPAGRDAIADLQALCKALQQQLAQKQKAIEAATTGKAQVEKEIAKLRAEIEPLEYLAAVQLNLDKIDGAAKIAKQVRFWNTKIPEFTALQRRITAASKKAYESLVVSDFEQRLDNEYKNLTEKGMSAFGVELAKRGADAAVTLVPRIGGKPVEGVLSEGEQRVHALALFFAELEVCQHSVIVFDDPVSSFDYNHVANYCARLRDFAQTHPTKQLVVLTHNWEFFVQLQSTFNSGGLNAHLSVQVLENCSLVAEYSEKIDELKADIEAVLALPGEPTSAQKEALAGKMRRLVEAVVNTHVFANQRQQYRQRKHAVSEFTHYTKLVPLEPSEASSLRDLYGKLSISEHDDLRNAYVRTDKATFQARYEQIKNIEAAIVSRKLIRI